MKKGIVAIVGRANVGKSTLFNRIIGERVSIVEDVPGVTRDRIYAKASWLTKEFRIIDTGGIELKNADFTEQIKTQAEIAIEEADVIIFVVNGREGLTSEDNFVARMLQKSGKPVLLAVNKIDDVAFRDNIYDFYSLGIGEPIPVSSAHGIGVGDLLDEVIRVLPDEEDEFEEDEIKVSIIGRPNVGKSSILNKLIEEEKAIVTSVAGTTRDIVEGQIRVNGILLNIIDTAGVRETEDIVEKIGVEKSLSLVNDADLIILVFNNNEKLTDEDKKLLEYTKEKKRIIVINKIDLENKLDKSILDNYIEISAKENIGIEKIKDEIKRLFNLGELEASDLTYMSNARSISLLGKSLNNINDAISEINNNSPIDIVEFHLKDAWNNLGEIIGETYTDELLDELFSRFCLGK